MTLPKVAVLSLGGTIAMTGDSGSGATPTLTGEDLVSAVPQLAEAAEVTAYSFRQVPGAHLDLEDLTKLAEEIPHLFKEGLDGIVITQGTDTIEETAFVLDLLVDAEAPIAVTGAMRNPSLPGADGPANLLASVQVAASTIARGLGTLVVLNDEVHAARFVRKTHTQSPATFRSSPVGPIGWISEGSPRIPARLRRSPRIAIPRNAKSNMVALLTVSIGDDGRLLPSIKDSGYSSLVLEAMGGGHIPAEMVEHVASLTKTMPVVLASRTGAGEILSRTYGFQGSETDLLERGLISAGPLDGLKARLLLTFLLLSGVERGNIAAAFDSWIKESFD